MVARENTRSGGGIEAISQQCHDETDPAGGGLQMIQRGELAFGDRSATSLALPASNAVGFAAYATRDDGMDRLDSAAKIRA